MRNAAVSVLLLGLIALALACSDSVPPPQTATPTATGGATPAPTPDPMSGEGLLRQALEGVEVRSLTLSRPVAVPENIALIIETGCTQCDGPTTGFVRVYRDPSGNVRTDTLLDPSDPGLGLPEPGPQDQRYVAGFAVRTDGSEIIAGVCARGYCGGLGGATRDSETVLFRSVDGGVTWTEYGRLAPGRWVAGLIAKGDVLTVGYDEATGVSDYLFYPSGAPLTPPQPGWYPEFVGEDVLLWRRQDGTWLRKDGSAYLPGALGSAGLSSYVVATYADGDPQLVSFYLSDAGYLLELNRDGEIVTAYEFPGYATMRVPLRPQIYLGNSWVEASLLEDPVPSFFAYSLPAVIDLAAGSIGPIAGPFLEPPLLNGRNNIVAVQRGSLLRVVNTGSCLNVREAPDINAAVLDCMVDGVLLVLGIGNEAYPGGVFEVNGETWLSVITPAGIQGFARAQYLER